MTENPQTEATVVIVPDKHSKVEEIEKFAVDHEIDLSGEKLHMQKVAKIRNWAKENGLLVVEKKEVKEKSKVEFECSYFDYDRSRMLMEFSVKFESKDVAFAAIDKKIGKIAEKFNTFKPNGEKDLETSVYTVNSNVLSLSLVIPSKYLEPKIKEMVLND